jgi:soluble lytic murein transglycosylase
LNKAHVGLLTALAVAGFAGLGPQADAAAPSKVPIPRPRPAAAGPARTIAVHAPAKVTPDKPSVTAGKPNPDPPLPNVSPIKLASATSGPAPKFASAPTTSTSSVDLANLKEAIAAARRGNTERATELEASISDPVARKLAEWMILRADNTTAGFARYTAFITANPTWPSIGALRRRAEAMMWQEKLSPTAVLAYYAKENPLSSRGKLALARAYLAQGDRNSAQAWMREAYYYDSFSNDLEEQVIEIFKDLVTHSDHKARMDMRLYAEDAEGAMRAANRAGGNAATIAKARLAVIHKAANAKAMIDALPAEARRDVGVIFSHAQLLRRADQGKEAGELINSMPRDASAVIDTDQWWIERRLVARKLLDLDEPKAAYKVARDAAAPAKENYRIEHEFTAGWIALRFLNDPATAKPHFAKITQIATNPISRARGAYWQGRTAEAMGRASEARAHYEAAAQYPTAYYGQIARAHLGYKDMVLRSPPAQPGAAQLEVVRAIELLYAVDERNLAGGAVADLGDRAQDAVALAAIGEITHRHKDARATLLVGKSALGRGLPLEQYAFPTIGIPDYRAVGPEVESSIVYAIARQESIFDQRTVSNAKAMGLMQVTAEAGRYVAKKFNVAFDNKRLLSDPIYNVQMGAAELGDLLVDYRGSYIMAFAGYNAGRGRVKDWVARFGDPRDPKVDPIDWVERIPFSETRNYVQRVMENVQVYRVRFGGGTKLLIEADLHRGAVN